MIDLLFFLMMTVMVVLFRKYFILEIEKKGYVLI